MNAGWFPDPTGQPGQRYFDGQRWTPHFVPTPPGPNRQRSQALKYAGVGLAAATVVGIVVGAVAYNYGHSEPMHATGVAPSPTPTLAPSPPPPPPAPAPRRQVEFIGQFVETDSDPDGSRSMTAPMSVTSCGDGCVTLSATDGSGVHFQANLIDGQWVSTMSIRATCPGRANISNAGSGRWAIDAATLSGTEVITWRKDCGGNPIDTTETVNVVLTRTTT